MEKKGAGGRKGGGPKKKRVSCSVKAGRIGRYLKKVVTHIGLDVVLLFSLLLCLSTLLVRVFLISVVVFILDEYLDGFRDYDSLLDGLARDEKKTRITPRHVLLAVRSDEELGIFLACVTIAQGGVLPNVNPVLLPKKSDKVGKELAAKPPCKAT
ncbi:histone H2A-like [Lycium barbarum]|uniref:histone H2A-like n=1 Tax=Lycium barbarum TaxID=112863 RepID=UPI00293F0B99|nr:histone H2A-like [Lycium barbarum]